MVAACAYLGTNAVGIDKGMGMDIDMHPNDVHESSTWSAMHKNQRGTEHKITGLTEMKKLPVIEFANSYGHTNFNMHGLTKDIGNVHLTKIKSAPGAHKCSMNDWVFMHYKGWNSKGKEIVNSKKHRNNHAAYYRVG